MHFRLEAVDVRTSVEEPPVAVQATAPILLSATRVPTCVVATWVSHATAAMGQLSLGRKQVLQVYLAAARDILDVAAPAAVQPSNRR